MPIEKGDRIERLPEVEIRTGYKKSSIYKLVKSGDLPAPIRIGPGAIGWISSEIDAWLAKRVEESRNKQEPA